MDKERVQIKTKLLHFLAFVDDIDKQNKIIAILEEYESKIPDGRLMDTLQKKKRKGMDYYVLCDSLIEDLVDKKLNDKSRAIISELIDKLTPLVVDEPKNWWEQFVDWFKNATGIK